jgi:hypothetical protein
MSQKKIKQAKRTSRTKQKAATKSTPFNFSQSLGSLKNYLISLLPPINSADMIKQAASLRESIASSLTSGRNSVSVKMSEGATKLATIASLFPSFASSSVTQKQEPVIFNNDINSLGGDSDSGPHVEIDKRSKEVRELLDSVNKVYMELLNSRRIGQKFKGDIVACCDSLITDMDFLIQVYQFSELSDKYFILYTFNKLLRSNKTWIMKVENGQLDTDSLENLINKIIENEPTILFSTLMDRSKILLKQEKLLLCELEKSDGLLDAKKRELTSLIESMRFILSRYLVAPIHVAEALFTVVEKQAAKTRDEVPSVSSVRSVASSFMSRAKIFFARCVYEPLKRFFNSLHRLFSDNQKSAEIESQDMASGSGVTTIMEGLRVDPTAPSAAVAPAPVVAPVALEAEEAEEDEDVFYDCHETEESLRAWLLPSP